MMEEQFRIYIDRLKDGQEEKLNLKFSSKYLDVKELELEFHGDVILTGVAYITDDSLILHLNLEVTGSLPCSVCNQATEFPLSVTGHYHVEPLENIKAGIFELLPLIRETILLECPHFIECHQGKCPERGQLEKYIKERSSAKTSEGGFCPFTDLKLGDINGLKRDQGE